MRWCRVWTVSRSKRRSVGFDPGGVRPLRRATLSTPGPRRTHRTTPQPAHAIGRNGVLPSHRRAIDPKGLAGDPPFDICKLLFNRGDGVPSVIARRVDSFTTGLGLDRARARQRCVLWAMLQACRGFAGGNGEGVK